MAQILQQLLFLVALAGTGLYMTGRIRRIVANVRLGKAWKPEPAPASERWRLMALFAFGQKKMFDKPLVGVMHFVIYAGFIIINIEILEIILDGLLGTHRLFAPYLGGFYLFVINFFEILAFGVLAVCVAFYARRNWVHIKRFHARELVGWPRKDGNIILILEIALMFLFLTWNGSDGVLRARAEAGEAGLHHYSVAGLGDAPFLISGLLSPIFDSFSTGALMAYERLAWWLHILGIFFFAGYATYSKHMHIGMAFPNIYYGRTRPQGQMRNMPEITREVHLMLGIETPPSPLSLLAGVEGEQISIEGGQNQTPPEAPGKFGARDVTDLSWKNLMDAYSCTECGRCTAACPANITGKLLSPRKIMMDTRDRMEEIGREQEMTKTDVVNANVLMDNYILREELLACTSCNACVTACPVNINPLDIILEMRRYAVMEESQAPASWNAMFQSTENNQAPWAYPPSERLKWMEERNG